ncbi:MAG: glycosyltransferase [Candidatus Sumerlaeia bacterium]|nr:glycosyltransferase [Candidatus Sumerlaeia bacterium]
MSNFFTIAICTYNNSAILPFAISSAVKQSFDSAHYEVVVIDNNSTDNTKEIVTEFIHSYNNLRLVSEPQQGLSFARNRAIKEARGNYIVYIDDDAELNPDYLRNLQKLITEEKNIGAVGGPVEVGWLGPVPDWYEPALDKIFNYLYIASYRLDIRYPVIIYGTNMAFPVEVLKELGGFNTALGRKGELLMAHEDNELLLRLQRSTNLRIIYDPGLKIRHLVNPRRLNPEYLFQRAIHHGRSQCIFEQTFAGTGGIKIALLSLLESWVRKIFNLSRGELTEKIIQLDAKSYIKEWIRIKFGRRVSGIL